MIASGFKAEPTQKVRGRKRFDLFDLQQPNAVLVGHQDVFAVIEKLQGLFNFKRVICSWRREFLPRTTGQRHSCKWPGRVKPSVAEKEGTIDRNDSPGAAKLG